ncbi:MAG: acetate--CoA ligase family protein, partial [Thermoplasmata archaeon]|nr:acetate--CoA ligase family protein [Thermoplasmata archaeon]
MNIEDIFLRARESGRRELTELESKKVFHSFGIPVVEGEIARTPEEAKQLTGKMGFPVVMKIASPDILHKTDVGGVKTGIKSLDGVEEAFKAIVESVHKKAPDARIEGITVQPMERRGLEVIVGGVRDPIFGNIVMFGLGGILTEVLKDVTFGLAPIIREEAREMIEG